MSPAETAAETSALMKNAAASQNVYSKIEELLGKRLARQFPNSLRVRMMAECAHFAATGLSHGPVSGHWQGNSVLQAVTFLFNWWIHLDPSRIRRQYLRPL